MHAIWMVLYECILNYGLSSVSFLLGSGEVVRSKTVILTTGTFLRGRIMIGGCGYSCLLVTT